MSAITKLSLMRTGTFETANVRMGVHNCGPLTQKQYTYTVIIDAHPNFLTPEGYILDNNAIRAYFLGRYGEQTLTEWESVSCETMAKLSAIEIAHLVKKGGVHVRSVTCSISGSNGVFMTAVWEADAYPLDAMKERE